MPVFCTQNTPVHKAVFIIFFRSESMKNKICKACEGFKATVYDCPDNTFERAEVLSAIKTEMQDMQTVCITIFAVISYLPV
jgi:V-type H+-transporting ATPase subunit a